MLNWIVWNWTVFDIETALTLNWIVIYNCLNSLRWKCFWQLKCLLMLNWTVFNRTDSLHKNGFGISTYNGWYAIKPVNQPTNHPTSKHIYIYIYIRAIGQMSRVFANGPGDRGSIPGRVIPKTQKMELDAFLLNTQHYMVRIKGKVEQPREKSSALSYTSVL